MLVIKKVASSAIPEAEGHVIDSFNTSDNKHTNAPSINAVENYVASTGLHYAKCVCNTNTSLTADTAWTKYTFPFTAAHFATDNNSINLYPELSNSNEGFFLLLFVIFTISANIIGHNALTISIKFSLENLKNIILNIKNISHSKFGFSLNTTLTNLLHPLKASFPIVVI